MFNVILITMSIMITLLVKKNMILSTTDNNINILKYVIFVAMTTAGNTFNKTYHNPVYHG